MHFMLKATIVDEVTLAYLFDVCRWVVRVERLNIGVFVLHPLFNFLDSLASALATYTTEAKRTIATNAIMLGAHATNVAVGEAILVTAVAIRRHAMGWMSGATLGAILKCNITISNIVASTFRRSNARMAVDSSNCMVNFGSYADAHLSLNRRHGGTICYRNSPSQQLNQEKKFDAECQENSWIFASTLVFVCCVEVEYTHVSERKPKNLGDGTNLMGRKTNTYTTPPTRVHNSSAPQSYQCP